MRSRVFILCLALAGAAMACDDDHGDPAEITSAAGDESLGTSTASPTARATATASGHEQVTGASPSATQENSATSPAAATPTANPTATPTLSGGATVTQTASQPAVVEAAIDDLATRLNVPRATISVVSAGEVEWSDGSLGCPQPGMLYTQALVAGYRALLSYGGQEYAYHGRLGAGLFYCENPQ